MGKKCIPLQSFDYGYYSNVIYHASLTMITIIWISRPQLWASTHVLWLLARSSVCNERTCGRSSSNLLAQLITIIQPCMLYDIRKPLLIVQMPLRQTQLLPLAKGMLHGPCTYFWIRPIEYLLVLKVLFWVVLQVRTLRLWLLLYPRCLDRLGVLYRHHVNCRILSMPWLMGGLWTMISLWIMFYINFCCSLMLGDMNSCYVKWCVLELT